MANKKLIFFYNLFALLIKNRTFANVRMHNENEDYFIIKCRIILIIIQTKAQWKKQPNKPHSR